MLDALKRHWADNYDEQLSEFRAEQLLDFVVAELGPAVYNQGVQDARCFVQGRRDDLEGEVTSRSVRSARRASEMGEPSF